MPSRGDSDAERSAASPRLAYLPALDGVRGACVLGVMLYHASVPWLPGAFLAVSTFFTLSGYLITSLLLAEQQASGRIALRRFWAHRLRRLLPAALLTVGCLVLTGPYWLPAAQRERLPEDALASLLYVVNWRFMSPQYAYDLSFADPSPFQHFWSLAIEGQFYLFFPLVVGIALRLGGARAVFVVSLLLTAGSIAAGWTVPAEAIQHRGYYGSDVRVGDLLLGVLLATVLHGSPALTRGAAGQRVFRAAGTAALAAIAVAWVFAGVGQTWVYRGGFAAYAVLSALLIAAASLERGPVVWILSLGWLTWIGTVSYGAYLFHWPLFMVLTPQRTGLPPLPLFFVRLAATLVLAGLSYRFIERPVRRGALLRAPRFAWAMAGSFVLVGALAIAVNPLPIVVRVLQVVGPLLAGDDAPPPDAPRFALFGDSSAQSLANGLVPWLRREGRSHVVGGLTTMGCGLFVYGDLQKRGQWSPEADTCRSVVTRWRDVALQHQPEFAVVLVGPWEVRNRRRDASSPALALGDPTLDAATRDAIAAAVDAFGAAGTRVIWLTSPLIRVPPVKGELADDDRAASDPARMERFNALLQEVARARPGQMRVVDLGAYFRDRTGGPFDERIRSDDVHFTQEGSSEVTRTWLGPEILRAARELRATQPSAAPTARP